MLNKPGFRLTPVDIAAAGLTVAAIAFFFLRMDTVLAYRWHWESIPGYFLFQDPQTGRWKANILLKGFVTTVKVSVWSMILAFALGTLSGIMGAKGNASHRFVSRLYVELVRNIPSLVLVIIFYYFVSSRFLDALGLDVWLRHRPPMVRAVFEWLAAGPAHINAFVSAVAALAIYEGAYISEIVRGGINAIPGGQWEAAWSMGLSQPKTFFLVILPQAFGRTAFPLAGQFISTIKDSAIVSIISIQDLTFQGMELMAATFYTFEIWITVTVLYFSLTFSLSRTAAFLEKRRTIRY